MSVNSKTIDIFKSKNGIVTALDFSNAYDQLGVQKGDVLFLQTQLFAFGKLVRSKESSDKDLLQLLIQDLKNKIGDQGTLMMTTYTLEPLKTLFFDIDKTRSEGGILTEVFRLQKDVKRSNHPTHSFAIWGNKKDFLETDESTFGDQSIYGKLVNENATLIFWGASFHYCTFNHFIEEKAKVKYRKGKLQNIRVNDNGQEQIKKVMTYSKSDRFRIDFSKFEKLLVEHGLLKKVKVGDGFIGAIKAVDLYRMGMEAVKKDEFYFIRKEPLFSFWLRTFKANIKSILNKLK